MAPRRGVICPRPVCPAASRMKAAVTFAPYVSSNSWARGLEVGAAGPAAQGLVDLQDLRRRQPGQFRRPLEVAREGPEARLLGEVGPLPKSLLVDAQVLGTQVARVQVLDGEL